MISLTSASRRRPGMSRAQFFDYLRVVHGAIARAEPGEVLLYRQNHVRDCVAGVDGQLAYVTAPDRDNITEVIFDGLPQLFADLERPYTREKLGPDGRNFSDLPSAAAFVGAVTELPVPRPRAGAAKVVAFVSARETLGLDEFLVAWSESRDSVDPAVLAPLASLVIQERLSAGDKLVSYFGGTDAPHYQGMISMTFDDESTALADAGRYLESLADVIDLTRSWRALVDEVEIYRR